ncbi:hypothetical protein [Lonepinella sp. MS14435]
MNWWLIGVGGTLALMSCIFTGLVIWANWSLSHILCKHQFHLKVII